MEVKVQIPFQQLLKAVQSLTPSEKSRLRQELSEETLVRDNKAEFIEMLLSGPVYSEKEIKTIEETRESIAKWRNKR
jgi:hypothetical protein